MSRWIDADALVIDYYDDYEAKDDIYTYAYVSEVQIDSAPSIDLDDYVPKDFHDKTCEAMAKRHQEEIANMVRVVRCKECKEWDKNDHECYLDRGGLYFPNADDYCSWAEREGE